MFKLINTKQADCSVAAFLLFVPLVLTLFANFVPFYLLLVKLLLALCFVIGGARDSRIWSAASLALLSLFFCSALWSVSPPLSGDAAVQLCYYVMVFLLFRRTKQTEQTLLWGFRLMTAVSLFIALDGTHQYFFRYDDYARYLQEYNFFGSYETEQVAQAWIASLSGRVFTQFFALPSQLAGYLLLILPLNAVLICYEKRRWLNVFWSIVFLLNGVILFLTKSFGAWLVFLCLLLAAVFFWLWNKRILSWFWLLNICAGFLITGAVIFFLIGYVRGQYLWNLQGNNPLWHRFLNWKTAFAIWLEHPFIGAGLGTFGAMYPQYMQPGANETQYAHNTYLQFGAELGIIGFALIMFLAGSWGHAIFKGVKEYLRPELQKTLPYVLYGVGGGIAGLGFLLHNIVDFTFYVFPLGLLGAAILGLTLNIFSSAATENYVSVPSNRRVYFAVVGLVGLGIIALFVKDWQSARAAQHKKQAVTLLQTQQYQEAFHAIQSALRLPSTPPEYHAIAGSILLYLHQPQQAIVHYRAAIEVEPVKPWFHAGLSEAYLRQKNLSMAYLESRRAAELFPLKSQYQQRMQQIQAQLPQ